MDPVPSTTKNKQNPGEPQRANSELPETQNERAIPFTMAMENSNKKLRNKFNQRKGESAPKRKV